MDRETIVERLERDLVGPPGGEETLSARPSDVYLTGILWPRQTRMGAEEDDRLGVGSGDEDTGGPASEEEEVSLAGLSRPCSAGISFAVAAEPGTPAVKVTLRCATYTSREAESQAKRSAKGRPQLEWVRRQHILELEPIPCESASRELDLANLPSGVHCEAMTPHGIPAGLKLHVRTANWERGRLVTLTALNTAVPDESEGRNGIEHATLFQVVIEVKPCPGTQLVARPSRRAIVDDEDRSAALLYRRAREFAAGHTCSVTWSTERDAAHASSISTTWVPRAIVPAVSARGHEVFSSLSGGESLPLSADWLSTASDVQLRLALMRLVNAYREWIVLREAEIPGLPAELRSTGLHSLATCRTTADRMEEGVRQISGNPKAALAFRLANRAMLMQHGWDPDKRKGGPLMWRPFQLGFFLLSVASLADRSHPHRGIMDLLWFPTGGGKTEAYLALIAFLTFHRRLTAADGPDSGAGVAALMRYTLRLLTTQQFSRAAAMMLACEAMRRRKAPGVPAGIELGSTPFSIGLWVGGEATPNKFDVAREALSGSSNVASPKQLLECPACGASLRWEPKVPERSIHVRCLTPDCLLYDPELPLPVWTVDEDVYRKQPTLLIGTVDKFAQIVRKEEVNQLFAIGRGLAPDLIIQDELHLISGPLGTVVGLYEAAVDSLFTREGRRPKIIGSTATIRRAADQVGALFGRETCQFPPPGLSAADSGFAVEDTEAPGRLYAAVTTAGRSAKFSLQGTAASLLQSAQAAFPSVDAADPYWTLVAYFNSLRELGGALVLMQDDVADTVGMYATRRGEPPRPVKAVEELTSRRSQDEVRDMLGLLATKAGKDGALDAVLASNMLSVGVDVPRLGVMLVNGQPKGTAEYIQATSRVGRRHPGLVVAVLNNAKARDRSHFETFPTWHATLYRDVEATSVTPFSSRARDRALHAVLVALVRHLVPGMLKRPDLDAADPAALQAIVDGLVARARAVDPSEKDVLSELTDRLEQWRARSPQRYWEDRMHRQSLLQSAERVATMRALGRSPGEAWATLNNMRNVEPSAHFRLAERLKDTTAAGGKTGGDNGQQ
ncbi:Superfamily II DNA and RNA helicase [Cystobacter fuscus DSM 2262]|uniref:Superfamily II DNA and RNA helicase n=1 Tax=Cystobacter fuscus (strain ATCC 25194 / DSM 2262 / NBRC 100088 / M29) TaxID=1242864 RepID=S9QVB6_CYSF2|nr:helicase-related protein [Cystobacter fuscus]EPX60588.1 Superfamily II DNA and RNA helicase [Cystobacter fuscus DSM 2262]